MNLKEKFYKATKNILLNNLGVDNKDFINKNIIFVYDNNSKLSQYLSSGYIKVLCELNTDSRKIEIINFDEIYNQKLKEKLLSLSEGSSVVLVQSTNFRLDDFRIRLNLQKLGVGCIEHNHLSYIKDEEIENYADSIEYKTPYYTDLSNNLKKLSDKANKMIFICNDGKKLEISGGFEDMKQNTGNFEGKYRGATFPIGENFTEAKIFNNVNGELSVYAYPDEKFQVHFCEPFCIKIEKSKIIYIDKNTPTEFKQLLDKIKESEGGEIMIRELGFGLNNGISKNSSLSDVNAFERTAGFHISLGKKHQIYRKKLDKKIIQRYHIDIFPDIREIYIDDIIVFRSNNYIL